MKLLRIEIGKNLYARLKAESDRSGRSVNQVVRDALKTALPASVQPAGTSFADLAKDAIGSAEGPEDLSSNPSNMDDYGK